MVWYRGFRLEAFSGHDTKENPVPIIEQVGAREILDSRGNPTVEVQQRLVDQPLIVGGQADHRGSDLVEDGMHRLLHTLPAVAGGAVAQFNRLVFTG